MRAAIFPLLLIVASGFGSAAAAEEMYDLIIRQGRIADGANSPWFEADVAISGDRIARIGRLDHASAKQEIDARGLIVAPGFIDIHSHSDWVLLEDGSAQSKVRQGVTTEVLGEGYSAGPFQGKAPSRQVTVRGAARRIQTLDDYFQAIEDSGVAVNVASYVGLNNVWESVMGQTFDRPTPEQLQAMQELVDQAMQHGAYGLSSQVMMPPGSLATTDELVALCRIAARHGGIYSTHIRNEGLGVFESVREAIVIGERARLPVDVIHLKIADHQYWGRMSEIIGMIEDARRRGVNVQANVYPYTRGNNNLASIIPPWAHEGGSQRMLERLRDPLLRNRLKQDIRNGVEGWYNHYTAVGGDWSRMLIADDHRYQELTMDRVLALETGNNSSRRDPLDILFELLLENDGSISTVYAHHTEEDMNRALTQPWCSIGSDGSALSVEGPLRTGNPHPRNFGTFPRVLGLYVRERKLLRLEEAVWKMTGLNAAKLGIWDRGQLRPGLYADITIFDPEQVLDRATYDDPFHYNQGVEYVIVNGELVLSKGEHTGARPGRALRKI